MKTKKTVLLKLYSSTWSIKEIIREFSLPSVTEQINSGAGSLSITLPRPFDDYGNIVCGDKIEIVVVDKEAPTGINVYSGEVSQINAQGSKFERVELECDGNIVELAKGKYRESTSVVFSKASADIAVQMKLVIDRYKTNVTGYSLDYTASSIATASKNTVMKINNNTYLELLLDLISISDAGYHFYVGADRIIYYKDITRSGGNPIADHYFNMKGCVISVTPTRSIAQTVSNYLFWNGLPSSNPSYIFKAYTHAGSPIVERWVDKIDNRITDVNTANAYANRNKAVYGGTIDTTEIELVDSSYSAQGYDIESINVGDTCKIVNVKDSPWQTVQIITSKTYNLANGTCRLVTSDVNSYLSRELLNQSNRIKMLENNGMPTTYTT